MKKLELLIAVPDEIHSEVAGEITKLLDKYEGAELKNIKISDAKPQGSGATVRDVL